jgi:nucleotide-binding universal stress UspA family protein
MATPLRSLEPAPRRFLAATDGTDPAEHAAEMTRTLTLGAAGAFRRLTTRVGLPGLEIVREAEAWGADLVVLGRRDRLPGERSPLGVTSDAVIRRRNGLTLLVPPLVETFRLAIIALDGSVRGAGVAAPAVDFLDLVSARAEAICVLPGAKPDLTDTTGWRDPRTEATSALLARLSLAGGPVDLLARWGDPVDAILRRIHETGSDLLILGVRRGGRRGDSGSGYIGRELLRSAPCAVLTVPI